MIAVLIRLSLSIALALVAGCAGLGAPAPSDDEVQQRCVRAGGWWRADDLMGGFCEFQSPGFI